MNTIAADIRTLILLIQMYFCKLYDYGKKADLSKSYWNPKTITKQ